MAFIIHRMMPTDPNIEIIISPTSHRRTLSSSAGGLVICLFDETVEVQEEALLSDLAGTHAEDVELGVLLPVSYTHLTLPTNCVV